MPFFISYISQCYLLVNPLFGLVKYYHLCAFDSYCLFLDFLWYLNASVIKILNFFQLTSFFSTLTPWTSLFWIIVSTCSLYLNSHPKGHMLIDWLIPSQWCCGEVAETLVHGLSWEKLGHWVCALEGAISSLVLLSCSCSCSHEVSNFAQPCASTRKFVLVKGTKAINPSHHDLKPLKPWSPINHFSF